MTATVTPEAVDGVTYDAGGRAVDVELGETLMVTATLDPAGVALGGSVGRWVGVGSATEATFTVTSEMSADPCPRVAPLAPVVTPSTCADGVVTSSVLTPQGPAEVVYSFDPAGTVGGWWGGVVRHGRGDVGDGDGDVAVAEHQWLVGVERWLGGRRDDVTRRRLTVPLTVGTCEATQPVVTVQPPQCVDGGGVASTVTPEAVDGVTYEPAEAVDVELGATVTVTATLDPDGGCVGGVRWPMGG